MDEKPNLQSLADRLKKLQKAFIPIKAEGKILKSHEVPPLLRLEIAKLYDEHGGIEILNRLTKVGYNTIRQWHKEYLTNPQFYKKQYNNVAKTKYTKRNFIKNVLGEDSDYEESKERMADFRKSNTFDEIVQTMPKDILMECKNIGEIMLEKDSAGVGIDDDVRKRVASLAVEADATKPIGIMLGLDERMIQSWIEFFQVK